MLTSLDHIIIAVPDLAVEKKMAALLGRPASWRGEHPGEGTANVLFRLDGFYLELMAPVGEGSHARLVQAHLDKKGAGVFGLSFATPDAHQLAQEWRQKGLTASEPAAGEGRESSSGAVRKWQLVFLPPEESRGLFVFAIEHKSPPDTLPLMPPDKKGGVMAKLDHVVVQSPDPAASGAFFETIGLRLALVRDSPQGKGELRFMRLAGVSVEIAGPASSAGDHIWGLAWRVDDLAAAHNRLAQAGFDISPLRAGRKEGTSVFTVRDAPAGIPTLIIAHQQLPV